ncbi:MAG: DUF1801 domain-containing protein [Fimbriimonadaceae bacterium]|nr:DUF1801 domain-containing protein [Fimbriimonadaceae bacterium]
MALKSSKVTVEEYLADLDHPARPTVETLRAAILRLDPSIREEVKWNAPSFALDDHFATFRLQPAPTCHLVLHTGAKKKAIPQEFRLVDPLGLARWAAVDRCVIVLPAATTPEHLAAVVDLVSQWLAQICRRPPA